MKNPYDIRKEKQLYYVIPDKTQDKSNCFESKHSYIITVIMYLFYEDTIDYYYKYVEAIPSCINLLVVSPQKAVLGYVSKDISKNNVRYILHQGSGRDISALLITAKEYVLMSDFVCFVHDKKNTRYLLESLRQKYG